MERFHSSPHPVTACASHHLADQTVLNAEAHMYLDDLLRNEAGSSVGLDALLVFGLLEFSALSDG